MKQNKKALTKRSKVVLQSFLTFSLQFLARNTGLSLDSQEMREQAQLLDVLYKEFIKENAKS